MKSLVVFDSHFGNTKKVAERIGEVLSRSGRVLVMQVANVQAGDMSGLNLLVVGSPTQQFSPTGEVKKWLTRLPNNCLQGVRAAAFDTRFPQEKFDEVQILSFFVRIFGFAAEKIAQRLEKKGANLTMPPEGFYVSDTEGPLLEKELERVAEWAERLL